MNLTYSIKVCDYCDTCVYEGEYEIRDERVICVMCIREEDEQAQEISDGRMGDLRPV